MKGWTATTRHEVITKEAQKTLQDTENLFRKISVNSGLKATKIIRQRKAFYRQRIPESSHARKETVDIDILVTSRNGEWKIMQSIRIMTSLKKKEVQPVEPVLKNIYQSNTYRKDLSRPHFDDEPRV